MTDTQEDASDAVTLKNASFSWSGESDKLVLSDITISVPRGSFVVVVGPVGAGKSSLLSAIVGELPCVGGTVCTESPIAYVSQQPWSLNATVQENILFDSHMFSARYQESIAACGLVWDLKQLANSDMTVSSLQT